MSVVPQMAAKSQMEAESEKEKLIKMAFMLGFMVSRNGYNGECFIESCAWPDLHSSSGEFNSENDFFDTVQKAPVFQAQMKQAIQRLK